MTPSKEPVCFICGKPNTKQRAWKGKPCRDCGLDRSMAAIRAMRTKSGPIWEKWKRNWQAGTGLSLTPKKGVTPDD
jgi:hypothetical protein